MVVSPESKAKGSSHDTLGVIEELEAVSDQALRKGGKSRWDWMYNRFDSLDDRRLPNCCVLYGGADPMNGAILGATPGPEKFKVIVYDKRRWDAICRMYRGPLYFCSATNGYEPALFWLDSHVNSVRVVDEGGAGDVQVGLEAIGWFLWFHADRTYFSERAIMNAARAIRVVYDLADRIGSFRAMLHVHPSLHSLGDYGGIDMDIDVAGQANSRIALRFDADGRVLAMHEVERKVSKTWPFWKWCLRSWVRATVEKTRN